MSEEDLVNKRRLINMVKRYGFYLPRSGPFCSISYIMGVLSGRFYAPKFTELRLRPCPDPPVREVLLYEV